MLTVCILSEAKATPILVPNYKHGQLLFRRVHWRNYFPPLPHITLPLSGHVTARITTPCLSMQDRGGEGDGERERGGATVGFLWHTVFRENIHFKQPRSLSATVCSSAKLKYRDFRSHPQMRLSVYINNQHQLEPTGNYSQTLTAESFACCLPQALPPHHLCGHKKTEENRAAKLPD